MTRASEHDKKAEQSKDKIKLKTIEVFRFNAGVSEISYTNDNKQKTDQSKSNNLLPVGNIELYHHSLPQEHGSYKLIRDSEHSQDKY